MNCDSENSFLDVILFFGYLSQSLSLDIFCADPLSIPCNLLNLHVVTCDNDNVVTDEVKLVTDTLFHVYIECCLIMVLYWCLEKHLVDVRSHALDNDLKKRFYYL